MNLLHLRGRKTSDFVLRRGRVWKGKFFTVYSVPGVPLIKGSKITPKQGIYLGTFASTKLDKSAVKRNRMRRRVREAFRITVQELDQIPPAQLLLSPRSASLHAPFEDIQKDVRIFLTQLSSWPTAKRVP